MDAIINNLIKKECKVKKQSSEQKRWFISTSNWLHTWMTLLTTWSKENAKFRTKTLIYFNKQLTSYMDDIIYNLIKRECKVQNKNVYLFWQAILISYLDGIINNVIKRECKVQKQSSEQKRWFISASSIDFIHGWHY